MRNLNEAMLEYHRLLEQGAIQTAYRGLMEYMLGLRAHFKNRHPEFAVSGGLYPGYMDMTYFACFPPALKAQGLKIAVVFLHEAFRFEVWLSGANREVQAEVWEQVKTRVRAPYRLAADPKRGDSIVEQMLAECPDFRDLEALTRQIEDGTLRFIADMEGLVGEKQT